MRDELIQEDTQPLFDNFHSLRKSVEQYHRPYLCETNHESRLLHKISIWQITFRTKIRPINFYGNRSCRSCPSDVGRSAGRNAIQVASVASLIIFFTVNNIEETQGRDWYSGCYLFLIDKDTELYITPIYHQDTCLNLLINPLTKVFGGKKKKRHRLFC